jgi:hypothetical protein
MKFTPTRTITLAVVLSRGIIGRWTGCLPTAHSAHSPSTAVGSDERANDGSKNRTLAHHVMLGSVPEQIRSAFTWRDAASRGLALLDKYPDTLLERDQQDRLRCVLSKVLQEDKKDAYMVWEDFRNIDGSKPLPNHNHWLNAIVRHLRHGLRVRNLFGPEISDHNLLAAFGRWDENITRTLRNVSQVVTAAQPVDGVTVALPLVWRTVFSYFAGLIAADQQILSCYRPYWEALPWRHNALSVDFAAKTETLGSRSVCN